jgi:hypothetical protein
MAMPGSVAFYSTKKDILTRFIHKVTRFLPDHASEAEKNKRPLTRIIHKFLDNTDNCSINQWLTEETSQNFILQ